MTFDPAPYLDKLETLVKHGRSYMIRPNYSMIAVDIAGGQVQMEVIKQTDLVRHLLQLPTDLNLAVVGHHKQSMGKRDDVLNITP
ncbi:MAG: hypothetical protein GY759_05235 [Chloroflexi bacterium]|nr:hypothetical protein [Chloroflexota bacterium]